METVAGRTWKLWQVGHGNCGREKDVETVTGRRAWKLWQGEGLGNCGRKKDVETVAGR